MAGTGPDRDDRRRIADKPFLLEPADHLLLQVELREALAMLERAARAVERAILDAIERLRRTHVRRELRRRPGGFESLHEVAGRDNLHAARANHLRGAGVHAREI